MLSVNQILEWIKNHKDSLSILTAITTLIIGLVNLILITLIDSSLKEIDLYDRQHQTKSVNIEFTSKAIGDNKFHVRYLIINKSKRILWIDTMSLFEKEKEKNNTNICSSPNLPKNPSLSSKEVTSTIEIFNFANKVFIPPESQRAFDYSVAKKNEASIPLNFCVEICSDLEDKNQNGCKENQYLQIYQVDFI